LGCGGLHDPAAVAVFDEGGGGGLDGGVFGDFGEGSAGFWSGGPAGDALNLVLIGDGVLGGVRRVVGNGIGHGRDVEVTEAEISVAGLIGVRSPGGVAFVGEVVEVHLFGTDEEALLLFGSAREESGVGEGIEVASAVVFGGIGFGWHLDWFRPDALVLAGVGIVDRGFELRCIELFFAGSGEKGESSKSKQKRNVSAHSKDLKRVGCRERKERVRVAAKTGYLNGLMVVHQLIVLDS
jgi:hypothetical protein